ncbi:hypothetical protein [Paludisphaera soli]|uniref:hypothetical protein n=1 Tax=Paludisphaera soli TaxID=2712865 RepID=UPI0013EBAD96|nr:hypothetical protein [Paludisphaera soli]
MKPKTVGPIATLAILLAALAPSGAGAEPAHAKFLATVADRFEENRAKFTRGRVRFDYLDGRADDPDAARKGEIRDPCTARCEYLFDVEGKRPQLRYEKEFPPEDMDARTKSISDSRTASTLDSFRALCDGSRTLFDAISWHPGQGLTHNPEIRPGSDDFERRAEFPYELGLPEPKTRGMARQIRKALAGEAGASVGSVEEAARVGDRVLARFTLRFEHGEVTYLVDPERSYVPLESRFRSREGLENATFYDDVRLAPNRGWLAFEQTKHLGGGPARRLVVREADFEAAPRPAEFALEFPEPVPMVDAAKGAWYRKPQKVWSLASLPSSSSPSVKKLTVRRGESSSGTPSDPLPGELEPPSWAPMTLALAAVGIPAVALAILAIRRRSARR